MKSCLILVLILISSTTFARVNQKFNGKYYAYYGELFYQNMANGTLTKDFVTAVLNSNHVTQEGKFDLFGACSGYCASAVSVGYDAARKILFGEIQKETDSQGTFVRDVYCGKKFYYTNIDSVGGMHTKVNIEHTWPQSRFSSRFPKGDQKSDMHHLYLTDSDANNKRGNFWFGNFSGPDRLNVENCPNSKLFDGPGGTLFEPPAAHKGNLARSLFYFSTRYLMPIEARMEKVLRQWHKEDPVDAAELAKHEIVAGYQKIRNPYIDHPESVDSISDF